MVFCFLCWLLIPVAIIFGIKFAIKKQRGKVDPTNEVEISGKTVIITGASDGIGMVTAEELAKRGAKVILACRSTDKAKRAVEDIRKRTGNGELIIMELDLSSLSSVRKFASEFISKYGGPSSFGLSLLINNAGIINQFGVRKVTKDGYEESFQVNHLGHFLLTQFLLPELERASQKYPEASRIVNVSSGAHLYAKLDFNDIMYERSPPVETNNFYISHYYANSKLANILFTTELAKRFRAKKVNVNSYTLCPGFVQTNIGMQDTDNSPRPFWLTKIILPIVKFVMLKDAREGAETTIYCALSKYLEHHSGEMYRNCKFWDYSERLKLKDEDATKLWELSEELVKSK